MKKIFFEHFPVLMLLITLTAILYGVSMSAFGLLDPDEPFYTLTAKNMLERNDPSTPVLFGEPQFEKPIFYYWVLYVSFKYFGVNAFAARIGVLIGGILTVIVTYLWGVVLFRRRAPAFLAAIILGTACEFVVLSRIVLTDIYLCLFTTASFFSFSLGYGAPRLRKVSWIFLFFFMGLGFLTKGPLGALIPMGSILIFLFMNRELSLLKKFPWILGILVFSIAALPWYILMTQKYGVYFLKHFFFHENIRRFFVAEHRRLDKFLLYPGVVFLGFFPWSFLMPLGMLYACKKTFSKKTRTQKSFSLLLLACLACLIFFTLAKSKLISYIFPLFPPMALILGAWAYRYGRGLKILKKHDNKGFLILASVVLGAVPLGAFLFSHYYNKVNDCDLSRPLALIGLTFVPLCLGALFFLLINRFRTSLIFIIAGVFTFTGLAFGTLLPAADPVFTSKTLCEFYAKHFPSYKNNLLICEKIFVRGVTFYTGNANVGVLTTDPQKVFYTKHPIKFFSEGKNFEAIADSDFPVFCFLRERNLGRVKGLAGSQISVTTCYSDAGKILLKLDRKKK